MVNLRLTILAAPAFFCWTMLSSSAFAHAGHAKEKSPGIELGKDPLYDVPDFALTDQDAKPFGRDAMLGKVAIVDFIFTACGDECPLMTSRMKRVQTELNGDPNVLFLTITTDPKTDDAATLKRYAANHKVSEATWRFLTGDKQAIVDLSVKGFKLAASLNSNDHSSKFVLVDAKARVRGYYDSADAKAVDRLISDAKKLQKQQ